MKKSNEKYKVWKTKDFIKLLYANGYEYISCNGSHKKFSNGKNNITVPKNLNPMIARREIREKNLIVTR